MSYIIDTEALTEETFLTHSIIHNDDGSITEFGQAAAEKMQPILEEAEKFGKLKRTYTDWIII